MCIRDSSVIAAQCHLSRGERQLLSQIQLLLTLEMRWLPLWGLSLIHISGNGWDLWKKIAAQDPSFGHPEKFCSQPELSNWESATITTLDDKIPQYIKKICKRDPFTGHTVTGGIVTVKDSSWLLSWTLNRQQQFRDQPKNQLCVWVYGLFSDKPGDYVKKPMRDCTGREICMESVSYTHLLPPVLALLRHGLRGPGGGAERGHPPPARPAGQFL